MKKKIYYHDTDCGGVVYYANYLKYFEEARTELMSKAGLDLSLLQNRGVLFVVRKVEVEYKSPAKYGDILEVSSRIEKLKNVTMTFSQSIARDGQLLVKALTQLVCINKEFSPQPIPEDLALVLKRFSPE
ncbi:MAG: YbgC/FadM family acyl-CoA thioesterase [Candidatus Omnitrophica bacterium]|nr:YbgC/FadM family acyl-CoA thioesterase [Candidatus Omnitrophota bacterium]